MGEDVPIDDNRTREGRATNRRVEFNLYDCGRFNFRKGWDPARSVGKPALEGRFLAVDEALGRAPTRALEMARAWWAEQPGDVLAALALGRGFAAVGSALGGRAGVRVAHRPRAVAGRVSPPCRAAA